jgi:hypothetical protein
VLASTKKQAPAALQERDSRRAALFERSWLRREAQGDDTFHLA